MKKTLLCLVALFCTETVPLHAQEDAVPRFEIRRYVLEGNTLLAANEVTKILSEHIGSGRDFGDIQQTIERLELSYRSNGYTMTTVLLPEQELTGGEVRLQAIESRVKEIKIEGNSHFSGANIRASLPTLQSGAPPKLAAISENLRVANENPYRKISLKFSALEKPEELEASLLVTDQKPWRVTLSGDNTGNRQSGYYRAGLSLQHGNLFDMDHVGALQYMTSPDHADKVMTLSGSYRIPIYRFGDAIDLFGAYSDVDSGTTQISGTDLSIKGKGIVTGFRYSLGLPRSGGYEQKLVMGMDYRRYENSATMLDVDLAPDVVAHPFSATYNGTFQENQFSFDFYGGVLHNEPWGGQGRQGDFTAVRDGAPSNYWLFRYGFNKTLALPGDWMIHVGGNGQYTPNRLIPGEQFGLGGSTAVRGYEEREESWDAGFSGSAEVFSPDIAPLLSIPHSQLRLLAFFDGGTGYNLKVQPGELDGDSLRSVGAGLRLGIGALFSFSLDWGHALDPSLQTPRGGSAVHFKGQLAY